MRAGVLYISYDGMLEPLGQSQVLAYLEKLAIDRTMHLISFEKDEDWADGLSRNLLAKRIASSGIHWHPQYYHKKPSGLATSFDIAVGFSVGVYLILRYRLRIVHARSYVPALMALMLKRLTGAKFLFDMRGFWADERVDGNLWPRDGRMYKVTKWFERQFLLNADHVVSLTQAAVREIESFDYLQEIMPPVSVISTCTDLERFVPATSPRPAGFVLGYVGSAGTWYLFDETVEAFCALLARVPNAKMLILNRGEHDFILQRMKGKGISPDQYELKCVHYSEVPAEMSRMNGGIFFIKPVFSKLASAPTKLGEFLGCGIPCLTNAGVGDMGEILECEEVGVAIKEFSTEALERGISRILELTIDPCITLRCREAALRHFSVKDGIIAYERIYATLAST